MFTFCEVLIWTILQEREKQRKLRVHEKSTYASRVNAKTASMRRAALGTSAEDISADLSQDLELKDDPGWTLAVTRGSVFLQLPPKRSSLCI